MDTNVIIERLYEKPVYNTKENVKLFIKEFIQAGKDSQIPLDETYLLYADFKNKDYLKKNQLHHTILQSNY